MKKFHFFIYTAIILCTISSCLFSKQQKPLETLESTCEEKIRLHPTIIANNGEGIISYDVDLVAYMKTLWPCIAGKPREDVIELFGLPAGSDLGEYPSVKSFTFSYDSKVECYNPRKTCKALYFLVDTTDLTVYNYKIMAFN